MPSYYEATVHRGAARAPFDESGRADVCVIGGGYAGLSAALELAVRGFDVVLLEATMLGAAASGRNGGQVLPGFGLEGDASLEARMTPAHERMAWQVAAEAIELVRQRIERHRIECDWQAGCLTLAVRPRKAARLARWFERVSQVHGYPLQWIGAQDMERWIGSSRYCAGVFDSRAGHLHPLKFCLGLAAAAEAAGVRIHEHSPVVSVRGGVEPVVRVARGAQLRCRFVVMAGGAESADASVDPAPQIAAHVLPVHTYMVATQQLDADTIARLIPSRAAISDTNFDPDYFRLSADDRLLFGGGDTVAGESPDRAIARIRRRMLAVFPQLQGAAIDYDWAGVVDLTLNRLPDFGRLAPNVYYVQGFSGHGVAMAGMAGLLAAEAVTGQASRFDLFAAVGHGGFPRSEFVRTPALLLGGWFLRLRDRF